MVVGLTWRFHCQDQVEPLVRKLRSCNLVVKKKKKRKGIVLLVFNIQDYFTFLFLFFLTSFFFHLFLLIGS